VGNFGHSVVRQLSAVCFVPTPIRAGRCPSAFELPLGLSFCYQLVMTKSSDNRKKRIGRPPVGAILIGVRVPPADVATLDAWIEKHAPDLSRPEAIRRLVELGLKATGK
jgi:hypothetical protein